MPRREPRVPTVRSTAMWVSPRAVHRTLYFNDNPLEREGRLVRLVSNRRFPYFASAPMCSLSRCITSLVRVVTTVCITQPLLVKQRDLHLRNYS